MRCGVCGGGVRGFSGILHGRPIKDWKHTDVPPGTQPHRPVLGTPVDQATLDRIHRAPVEELKPLLKKTGEPPRVYPRPLTAGERTECSSADSVFRLMIAEDWRITGVPTYLQTADGCEYIVIKARRRDLGAVAVWRRRPEKKWEFDEGWALTHRGLRQVGSYSLKNWLKQRDEECPDCGASSAVHEEECVAA